MPNLKGERLRADKRKLKKNDCKRQGQGQGDTVKKQSVKRGKFLPLHSKVGVKLG